MVDDDLVTSLIYSCSIGVIVSSFYLILWLTRAEEYRRRSYLLLSASFVFYALRVASHLFLATELPLIEALNELLYVCWVSALCIGVYVYREKRALSGRCFIWPGLMAAWVAFGQIADLSFFVRTLPLHAAGAAYFWFAAGLVWQWSQERINSAFAALAAMLWAHGLVTLVTPFIRATWFAPYSFTIMSILGLATGMALMLIALMEEEEEIRRYKDHLEEAVHQRTEELRVARDSADAANKAKSVFLANMSHELRTPLNAILGFSTMMRRDPGLSASQRNNLDIINRSGEHLLALINDVLEVAKIEAGRLKLDIAPFDLGAMVRDVADMMGLRALERGIYLEVDQSSSFPRFIKGDEARMRQILVNLVGNAVKFTQVGGVVIRLGVKPDVRGHLEIEIEDTGPGIREEEQKRLFQPFSQFARVGLQRGTGLGLAITRQFVELMGGAISVRSVVGKGSTFRVELPLQPVTDAELKLLPAAALAREVVALAPGQPLYRILIAEDQTDNRLLLERMMSSVGFETKTAVNGADCIRLFMEWRPHLIWMDRRMPVMDGVEATRRIRLLPGGEAVRIVAVTASAFKEERKALFDAGIDDIVRKPYHPHEIYDCLARRLGVEYVYASAAPGEDGALRPELLAALPADLRRKLREALESLDANCIQKAIDDIGAVDARLARTLSRRTESFDYPAILQALNSCAA